MREEEPWGYTCFSTLFFSQRKKKSKKHLGKHLGGSTNKKIEKSHQKSILLRSESQDREKRRNTSMKGERSEAVVQRLKQQKIRFV